MEVAHGCELASLGPVKSEDVDLLLMALLELAGTAEKLRESIKKDEAVHDGDTQPTGLEPPAPPPPGFFKDDALTGERFWADQRAVTEPPRCGHEVVSVDGRTLATCRLGQGHAGPHYAGPTGKKRERFEP
jgi:hypothetical protein